MRSYRPGPPALALAILLSFSAILRAAPRFFDPPAGYVAAKDLPEDFRARIRSVRIDRKDAFDGSVAHSNLERKLFALGNRLHIESRESTIRRRLLFSEGGEITKHVLAETERALRTEEFLADAIVAAKDAGNGSCDLLVTTFDQFTTIPVTGGKVLGLKAQDVFLGRWDRVSDAEWFWWVGAFETNILGTGTKVGASLRYEPERDTRELVFANNNMFAQKLQVTASAALLSDGDSLALKVAKPLLSRTDRYAYGLSATATRVSERLYFDANQLGSLPPIVAEKDLGQARLLRVYDLVTTNEFNASYTRSFGSSLKFNIGPTFQFRERYGNGKLGEADSALAPFVPIPSSANEPEERKDVLPGIAVSLYRNAFATARNFRNLKWGESVETGWRLTTKAAMNQEWLGASGSDFRLVQEAAFSRFWSEARYINATAVWQSFLSPAGRFSNGQTDLLAETYWREHSLTATFLSAAWSGLFASPRSRQLTLGELNGLVGYPSYYYSGQSSLVAAVEQRMFPDFELLTFVPAFAAFLAAGNTFPDYSGFDPGDLHYSLGLGVRLGRSKSTQKIVQHINVSFPLGDRYLDGPVISVLAKKTL